MKKYLITQNIGMGVTYLSNPLGSNLAFDIKGAYRFTPSELLTLNLKREQQGFYLFNDDEIKIIEAPKESKAERLTHALNISVHEYLNHAIQTATYEYEYKRACHVYDIIFTTIHMKKEAYKR